MADTDPLESAFLAGAAAALRRRAARQAKIAAAGTTLGERGATIRTGESQIARILEATFSGLAAELEREAKS